MVRVIWYLFLFLLVLVLLLVVMVVVDDLIVCCVVCVCSLIDVGRFLAVFHGIGNNKHEQMDV